MEVILQTYYILLPIIATTLIGWVGYLLKAQKKKEEDVAKIRESNSAGIRMILRYMLRRYHSEYMAQGEITYKQFQDWVDFYTAYENLNGNSVAVEWDADIKDLPKSDYLSCKPMFERLLDQAIKEGEKDG